MILRLSQQQEMIHGTLVGTFGMAIWYGNCVCKFVVEILVLEHTRDKETISEICVDLLLLLLLTTCCLLLLPFAAAAVCRVLLAACCWLLLAACKKEKAKG